jgi:hypothetical protein
VHPTDQPPEEEINDRIGSNQLLAIQFDAVAGYTEEEAIQTTIDMRTDK